jgi:hypothetical protein
VRPRSDAANGWNVSFSASIIGTGVTTYLFWRRHECCTRTTAPGRRGTIRHLYRCAGPYSVSLTILSDCQPFSLTVLVQLPTCGCPHISSEISGNPVSGNPCTWNFIAKVGGPYLQCNHEN